MRSRAAGISNALLVLTTLFAFAYALHLRMLATSSAPEDSYGSWDLIVDVAFNPQLLSWVVVPVWIIGAVRTSELWEHPPRLVRSGSRAHAATILARFLCSRYLLGAGGVLIVAGVAGIGLPVRSRAASGTSAGMLSEIGVAPVIGLLLQALLVGSTLCTVSNVIVTARLRGFHSSVVTAFGAAFAFWVLSSASGLISAESALNAAPFLDFTVVAGNDWGAARVALTLGLVNVLCRASARRADRVDRDRHTATKAAPVALMLCGILMVPVAAIGGMLGMGMVEVFEATVSRAWATTVQLLAFLWVFMSFYVSGLLSVAVDDHASRASWVVRFGSYERWIFSLTHRQAGAHYAAWLALMAAFSLTFVIVGGAEFSPATPLAAWLFRTVVLTGLTAVFFSVLGVSMGLLLKNAWSKVISVGFAIAFALLSSCLTWSPFTAVGAAGDSVDGDAIASSVFSVITIIGVVVLFTFGAAQYFYRTGRPLS